jgi:hypothetical protein
MSTATSTRPATGTLAVVRTAPRRRSIAQGALAVLLIVGGALTAGYVAQRMGSTHDFLAVARPIGAGAQLTAADLLTVRVNDAVGLRPIPAGRANTVIGKHAVMGLVPGTLLTMAQLTDSPIPSPGHQLIGLALDEDQMPGSRLAVGAAVLLVVIPDKNVAVGADPNAPDLVPPRTITATVVDITASSTKGQTLLNVEVATADAATVAALAADDRIVIALAGL